MNKTNLSAFTTFVFLLISTPRAEGDYSLDYCTVDNGVVKAYASSSDDFVWRCTIRCNYRDANNRWQVMKCDADLPTKWQGMACSRTLDATEAQDRDIDCSPKDNASETEQHEE